MSQGYGRNPYGSPYGADAPVAPQGPVYPAWPTVGGPTGASLSPFSGVPDPNNPNVTWIQTPCSEPAPWLPLAKDNSIGFFVRWYVLQVLNATSSVETLATLQIDIPGFIYEMAGAAIDSTGAALPVGLASLDTFQLRLDHAQGDRLITAPSLGSSVCGTAQFPAKVGLPGWKFNRGSTAFFGITPRRSNLLINVVLKFLEIRAGANFSSLG